MSVVTVGCEREGEKTPPSDLAVAGASAEGAEDFFSLAETSAAPPRARKRPHALPAAPVEGVLPRFVARETRGAADDDLDEDAPMTRARASRGSLCGFFPRPPRAFASRS